MNCARGSATFAAIGLFLLGSPAFAVDVYFASDGTIDVSEIFTRTYVGYANQNDLNNQENPASPTVNIVAGGGTRELLSYNSSIVNISGGKIGQFDPGPPVTWVSSGDMYAYDNSTINITDGLFGQIFAQGDSDVTISGGNIFNQLEASSNAVVNISGGTFGSYLSAASTATINIYGGTFSSDITANEESTLNFFGTNLTTTLISSNELFSLYALSGTLADGTVLNNKEFHVRNDTAHFTVNAIPEPSFYQISGLLILGGLSVLRTRKRRAEKR